MKRTIKSEGMTFIQKRFFELAGTLILLAVAIVLLCSGMVLNPFRVADIRQENDIKKAYVSLHKLFINLFKIFLL